MGNRASINVILDHDGAVLAGSVLKGRVVVKVTSPVRAEKVTIRIYGKEKIWAWVRDQRVVTERPLLSSAATVAQFSGRNYLHPGTYSYPFTTQLPVWLPSSAEYMNCDDNAGFRIRYKIQCQMGRRLKSRECFTVAASPSPLPLPSLQEDNDDDNDVLQPALIPPTAFPIESSLSTTANNNNNKNSMGWVTFAARADRTRIEKGDVLEVHLACRNHSRVSIRRVGIKLTEHMDWREQRLEWTTAARRQPADGSGEHHETLLQQDDLSSLPGLRTGRSDNCRRHQESMTAAAAAAAADGDDQEAMLQDLVSGENKVSLKIPSRARDSYSGQLVRIRHVLEITAHTDGKTVNNPVIRIPIHVVGSSSLSESLIAVATPVNFPCFRSSSFPVAQSSSQVVVAAREGQDTNEAITDRLPAVQDDAAGAASSSPIVLVYAIPAEDDDDDVDVENESDESSEVPDDDDVNIITLGREAFVVDHARDDAVSCDDCGSSNDEYYCQSTTATPSFPAIVTAASSRHAHAVTVQ